MPTRTDSAAARLPRNFVRPCVLLLLREHDAHGYELLERLAAFGFTRDDPGRLYRTLRQLEREGLVRSWWERSASGPDRRVYGLTRTGAEDLHVSAKTLARTRGVIDVFLSRYSEFAALAAARGAEPAQAARRSAP